MSTEYKLSYTADEINEKLGKVDENTANINYISEEIAEPLSWNDLEDKPFYEHTEEKTILPTTSCNAVYCGLRYGCGVNSEDGLNSFLEEGKVYKVVFDGVEYVKTAEVVNNIVVLGNKKYGYNIISSTNTNEDTGEPFFIANFNNGLLGLQIRVEYEESFTISISSEDCVLKQLDEKYIPDTIARDNAFHITLIDNGDSTYSVDKSFEEIITAWYIEKKNLVLDNSCIVQLFPIPNSLPFVGNFGGGFQFGVFVDDNGMIPDSNCIPTIVGVVITPSKPIIYCKNLFDSDIGLLKTENKHIIGAINELKAEIDALKTQNQ